jgi:hypothetical protein
LGVDDVKIVAHQIENASKIIFKCKVQNIVPKCKDMSMLHARAKDVTRPVSVTSLHGI